VPGARKARHIRADFGEQHVRRDHVDARDGLQELKLRAQRLQLLIRLQVEHLDVGIELFDVREVHAQQEPMMVREPALESVDDLLAGNGEGACWASVRDENGSTRAAKRRALLQDTLGNKAGAPYA